MSDTPNETEVGAQLASRLVDAVHDYAEYYSEQNHVYMDRNAFLALSLDVIDLVHKVAGDER